MNSSAERFITTETAEIAEDKGAWLMTLSGLWENKGRNLKHLREHLRAEGAIGFVMYALEWIIPP